MSKASPHAYFPQTAKENDKETEEVYQFMLAHYMKHGRTPNQKLIIEQTTANNTTIGRHYEKLKFRGLLVGSGQWMKVLRKNDEL